MSDPVITVENASSPSIEPFLQAGAPERKFRSKSNCLLLYPANTGSLRGPVPDTLRRLISAVNAFPLKFTTRRPPAGNFHTTRTMVFWCPLVATKSCMNERSDLGSEAASMPMFTYSIRGRLQLRARLREVRLRLYATIVECGCWKGGMSAALIEIGGFQRDYYFFDSFEGLPPAKAIDGPAALAWQADTASPSYHDNCTASIDDFRRTVRRTGCPEFPSTSSIE